MRTKYESLFAARLGAAGVVGVLRAPSAEQALIAVQAAVRGGLKAVEVTLTTPGAEAVLDDLSHTLPKGVLLGAGTVLSTTQAETAIASGATFLVSPHLGENILEVARYHSVSYVPGVLTPTEIVRALQLGVGVLKVFPIASAGGVSYLKHLRGPFPNLQVMVTGGVSPHQATSYREAGALAVGIGSNLFPEDALTTGDAHATEQVTPNALRVAGMSR